MKVIAITGTRGDARKGEVRAYLEEQKPDVVIVGDATGVDAEAYAWGKARSMLVVLHAPWKAPGKVDAAHGYWPGAGYARNRHIARVTRHYLSHFRDVWCAAFPGDRSRGTWDCVTQMREVPLVDVRFPGDPKWSELARSKGLLP